MTYVVVGFNFATGFVAATFVLWLAALAPQAVEAGPGAQLAQQERHQRLAHRGRRQKAKRKPRWLIAGAVTKRNKTKRAMKKKPEPPKRRSPSAASLALPAHRPRSFAKIMPG
jgi:hypothetical protein